jgi:exopolyphosphatase/guanosine-5'-triphosphate,3'-diphosphate pyrophosphatase
MLVSRMISPPEAGLRGTPAKKNQGARAPVGARPMGGPSGSAAGNRGRGELLAVLDLGTNNCRLLIARPAARDSFRAMDSFSRIVRLGEGVAATGRISDAAMDRTIDALKICAQHIAKSGARHVRAVATQAARLASNADVLVARARDEAGIALTVISAEAEADLAALGCAPLIGHKYKGALIFDIGGGSTEIIHLRRTRASPGKVPGAQSAPDESQGRFAPGGFPSGDATMKEASGGFDKIFAASLPFGVVTLSESYGAASQSRAGFEAMRQAMHSHFVPYAVEGFDPKAEHLLGTSGTVTTLAALALKLPRYNRTRVDGSWHETSQVARIVERISELDVAALAKLGPIGPERADLMLAGCAIFGAICALWPSRMLRVADRGLREGMLRQLRQELGQEMDQ